MKKEEIIQTLKDNPIKIIKCGDIEIPVEYLKQTTVNVNGDDYIKLQQENKILKDNWNKLKEYISSEWYCFDNESVEFEVAKSILNKMHELEQGSDNNGQ